MLPTARTLGSPTCPDAVEHLVERKILTRADVRTILGSGIECLEPRINVRSVAEAVHLMRNQMLPLFSE
jgi:hypothetical protein